MHALHVSSSVEQSGVAPGSSLQIACMGTKELESLFDVPYFVKIWERKEGGC